MGVLIPGMAIGIAPINTPSVSPTNMASRFGLSSRFSSSPNILPTLFTELASPTIVSLSPICRRRSREATRSIPARFTRVMLIPYRLRSRSEPSFTPFTRVTTIRREINWLSIAFQSISSLFQSVVSCSPKSTLMDSTSAFTDMISKWSFSFKMVSEVGIVTFPFLQRREITKCFSVNFMTCWMLLL